MKDYTKFPLLICDGCYLDVPGERIAIALAGGHKDYEANARRIQATWNACLDLDLPEDCPPGILAELLASARAMEHEWKCENDLASSLKDFFGILAKLAPAGSPDNGKSVLPPEPEDYYQRCRRETAEYHAAKEHPGFDLGSRDPLA